MRRVLAAVDTSPLACAVVLASWHPFPRSWWSALVSALHFRSQLDRRLELAAPAAAAADTFARTAAVQCNCRTASARMQQKVGRIAVAAVVAV